MLQLWVLIIVAHSGVGSVEFRTREQCEAARTAIVSSDLAWRVTAACAQKTVGGP